MFLPDFLYAGEQNEAPCDEHIVCIREAERASTFADELQQASDRIADIPRADLQSCFLRAALMIRNTDGLDLDPGLKETLCGVAVEMELAKSELIKTIIGVWLIANAYRDCSMRKAKPRALPDTFREVVGEHPDYTCFWPYQRL